MTGDKVLGHTQLSPYPTHFVLEEPLQWFTELEVHLLRQSAYIVMTLDDLACDIQTLYSIGIDGALCQPLGTFNLLGFGIEDLYKITADNLSLLLRIGHSCQIGKKLLTGINTDNVQSETLIIVHHIGKLILAQHSVINEDTGKVVADGTMEQYCCHRRIDTP